MGSPAAPRVNVNDRDKTHARVFDLLNQANHGRAQQPLGLSDCAFEAGFEGDADAN